MAILRYIGIFLLLIFSSTSISSAKEVTYRDDMGRIVRIPIGVKRAVFLAYTPELIPALNIWNRVVGIDSWSYEDNELFRVFKTKWKDTILSLGDIGNINIEVLLKLKPDLITAWSVFPEEVKFIENKGLRVIGIHLGSLHELYDLINLCGKVFEKEKEATRTIEQMERILKLVKERVGKIPVDKKRKVLWIGIRPTLVVSKGSMPGDMLTNIIKAINPAYGITGTSPAGWVEVSIERIITWNPDVIFIVEWAKYNTDDILNNPQWRHIKAVKDGKVYKAPLGWSLWSPTFAPLSLWVASKIYPEYFKDVDFEKICDDFFKEVYGIPYSKVKSLVSSTVK